MKVFCNFNTPINIYSAIHHSIAPTACSLSPGNFIKLQSEANGHERSNETPSKSSQKWVCYATTERTAQQTGSSPARTCVQREHCREMHRESSRRLEEWWKLALGEEQLNHTLSTHLTDHRLRFCIGRNRKILLIKVSLDVQILNKFRVA